MSNLNTLFVNVDESVENFNGQSESLLSKELFFDENNEVIWAKGK